MTHAIDLPWTLDLHHRGAFVASVDCVLECAVSRDADFEVHSVCIAGAIFRPDCRPDTFDDILNQAIEADRDRISRALHEHCEATA